MKVLVYSAKDFEIPFLEKANQERHPIKYISERLTSKTVELALGFSVVSIFSADEGSPIVLEKLKDYGVKCIALRSAGYDNVNLKVAKQYKLKVANAPGYSPNAIAEHAVALLLALGRNIILAEKQVKNYNFSLSNLVGYNLENKVVGIIGTGKIGKKIAKIMHGFSCNILAHDLVRTDELVAAYNVYYVTLEELCKKSDIIMISVPLNSETHHLIDAAFFDLMKNNAVIINIARGAIVQTKDLIKALEKKKIAAYGADVYEHEKGIFFYDHSKNKPEDNILQRLMEFPNVLLTPHQAFATNEALTNIATTTFYNIDCWDKNEISKNELTRELVT